MSGLWTPGGGEPTPPQGNPVPAPEANAGSESEMGPEAAAEMARIRSEIASISVADHIANHAIGLWQLAVIHLTPDTASPTPNLSTINLDEARLAIDAMACLVDGLGSDLGENAETLQEALAQLRLAYVEVSEQINAGN